MSDLTVEKTMITLKRYLENEGPSYRKIILLLLNGMAQHGACANTVKLEAFRNEMKVIREPADAGCNVEQLLALAGASVQALDNYNARTTRLIRRQAAELQNMISMLAQTVISISGGSERATEALTGIKRDLEQASDIEDVQTLKFRLGDCLRKVCSEASRQQNEAAAVMLELQRNVESAQSATRADLDIDSVTELPKDTAAKAAFADALKSPGRKYIVTMVVNRLQPINARFGVAIGDDVLRAMRKYIVSKVLSEGDRLFRWTGPTLIALIARQETIDQVRSSLKRLLDIKIENEFDLGTRSVLIPLSVSWTVMGLIPPATNIAVFIDRFVATQVPQDYC